MKGLISLHHEHNLLRWEFIHCTLKAYCKLQKWVVLKFWNIPSYTHRGDQCPGHVTSQHQLHHFTAIYNFSPMDSWDCKCPLDAHFRISLGVLGILGTLLTTVLWWLWIWAYSVQILFFVYYIVGKFAISDAAMVLQSKQDKCYYC